MRLILAASISSYLIVFFYYLVTSLYQGLGADYLAFWSAGKVADELGYGQIYDISLLREFQAHERIQAGLEERIGTAVYTVSPVSYFSVFILPFQLLSKLPVLPGFIIWTGINVVLLAWYFIKYQQRIQLSVNPIKSRYLLLAALSVSLPVFQNLFYGQLKVFTVIFLGEMIICARRSQLFKSGLWLGGLLLFPQLLILVLPYLVITRRWKTLAGFATSAVAIVLISIALSGFSGLVGMTRLILNYIPGMATNNPQNMMNWRMTGIRLNDLLGEPYGWIFVIIGSLVTLFVLMRALRQKSDEGSDLWVYQMTQIFAATLVITWHSHIHMAMCLLPLLLFCGIKNGFNIDAIYIWSIVPSIVYLVGILVISITWIVLKNELLFDISFLLASVMLGMQLYLLKKFQIYTSLNGS